MSNWNDVKKNIISLSQEDWENVEIKVEVSEEIIAEEEEKLVLPKEGSEN